MFLDMIRFNTLKLRRGSRLFADTIFKFIYLYENCCILFQTSSKSVPTCSANNNQALVEIMAWHKSVTSHYLNQWTPSWLVHTYGIRPRSVEHFEFKFIVNTWWGNQMETFSALLALYEGNSPVTGEFPSQRPVTRSFDVSSISAAWTNVWVNNRDAGDLRRHRRSLWRHCNGEVNSSKLLVMPHTNTNWPGSILSTRL